MDSQEDCYYGTNEFFNRGIRKCDKRICWLFILKRKRKSNCKEIYGRYKKIVFLADAKRINKEVLLQYKDWLVQNYVVNCVNSMLAALNQFLEFLNLGNLKVKRIKVQKQPFFAGSERIDRKRMQEIDCNSYGRRKRTACIVYWNNNMYRNSD